MPAQPELEIALTAFLAERNRLYAIGVTDFRLCLEKALAAIRKTHETVSRERVNVLSGQHVISQPYMLSVIPRNDLVRIVVGDAARAIMQKLETSEALNVTEKERDGALVVTVELTVITPPRSAEGDDNGR